MAEETVSPGCRSSRSWCRWSARSAFLVVNSKVARLTGQVSVLQALLVTHVTVPGLHSDQAIPADLAGEGGRSW